MSINAIRRISLIVQVLLVVDVVLRMKDIGIGIGIDNDPILMANRQLPTSMIKVPGSNTSSHDCCDEVKSSTHVDHFIFEKHQQSFGHKTMQDQRPLSNKNLFVANPWVSLSIVEHNAKFIPDDMEIHVFNHTSMTRSVKLIDQQLKQVANVTGAWEAYQLL